MVKIRLCDFLIEVKMKYKYTFDFLADYITKDEADPDFSVSVTDDELNAELEKEPRYPLPYHETLCLYRKICKELSLRNCFMMHSSVVVHDDKAFVFTAKSGTGKTTHSNLWLKNFPGSFIINGDKPLFRLTDDGFYVYGTPWSGKEGYNKNTKAKVSAVCFIEQKKENSIRPLSIKEVLGKIFEQLYIPEEKDCGEKVLALLDKFLSEIPSYLLGCNISDEAALIAESAMNKRKD